jgi:hypothetical protein
MMKNHKRMLGISMLSDGTCLSLSEYVSFLIPEAIWIEILSFIPNGCHLPIVSVSRRFQNIWRIGQVFAFLRPNNLQLSFELPICSHLVTKSPFLIDNLQVSSSNLVQFFLVRLKNPHLSL